MPQFQNTFCSQCGQEFGPGDHGYSHCRNHRLPSSTTTTSENEIETIFKTEDNVRVSIDSWDNGGAWLHLSMKHGTASAILTRYKTEQMLVGLQLILAQEVKA